MAGSPQERLLQVTVRVDGAPISTRALSAGADLLPDTPVALSAANDRAGFTVSADEGAIQLREGEEATLRRGGLQIEVGVIPRVRLPRFGLEQGDAILPAIILTVTLFLAQLQLLLSLLAPPPAADASAPEPTPEFIARLLNREYDGQEVGKIAEESARPEGEGIESFYMPSGHMGPSKQINGGKNVGDRVTDGAMDAAAEPTAPPVAEVGTELLPEVEAAKPDEEQQTEDEDGEEDAEQIARQITRGWGFTDWYTTEDARQDAEEIKEKLDESRELLKIDPDSAYALSVRAYYEYLSMDYKAARKTYEKFTELYPDEAAGWNNLALTYKRTGEYQREEELYRIALRLSPGDDHALNNLAVCLAHQGRYEEALAIMEDLERIIPGDAYADLHRAKIYAAMGDKDKAYDFLQRSLAGMRKLDTLHNIEFRQDIRIDPAFEEMRKEERFEKLLDRFYGEKPGGWWRRRRDR